MSNIPEQLTGAALETRLEELMKQLTLDEKVSLLSGRDVWYSMPVERLGIPSLVMTDGPHGVRTGNPETGRPVGPATCFPTGIAMASSWDVALMERVGVALGEETRGLGCDILLGPCINMVRAPLGGRNFETYSEDPYLAGRLAVAFIKGVQSQQAGTSVKHFAANNQEIERMRSSSNVDERTLREIYLPAFEAAVKEAQPWTVMCSYNRLNGVYASQNDHLLNQILKQEWGFEGFVVSDWSANHTIVESLQGGLDMEMPGPAKYYGSLLTDAIYNWQIGIETIDAAVRRILRVILRSGKMDNATRIPAGAANTPAHQALARQAAEESITLLKNEAGVLPLNKGTLHSLAVIGLNAAEGRIGGGGSSYVIPPYRVSPLEGLRQRLGEQISIEYEPGCDNYFLPPAVASEWLTTPDGRRNGLTAEYYNRPNFEGEPQVVADINQLEYWWVAGESSEKLLHLASARWSGTLTLPEGDDFRLYLDHSGAARLYLDGELFIESRAPDGDHTEGAFTHTPASKTVPGGKSYVCRIEFQGYPGQRFAALRLLQSREESQTGSQRIQRAVEAARRCQAAIIFAGMPEGYETEGWDRPHMLLPGPQDELIRAVAAVQPNTIVVLNVGSPVSMPWLELVPVVVQAYYPGMEGGNAVAGILLGEINPSGKLTETFPKRLEENPAYLNTAYPGIRELNYGEGIFVGYRYYDTKQVEPAFPFGHGLSYTSFEYQNLRLPEKSKAGELVPVELDVTNIGNVAGKEVVQLYVGDVQASLPRPVKELKGFAKLELQPGETKSVRFQLDERAFAFYEPKKRQWVVEPGEFEILVGSSSRDIRLKAKLALE